MSRMVEIDTAGPSGSFSWSCKLKMRFYLISAASAFSTVFLASGILCFKLVTITVQVATRTSVGHHACSYPPGSWPIDQACYSAAAANCITLYIFKSPGSFSENFSTMRPSRTVPPPPTTVLTASTLVATSDSDKLLWF